ncbi:unnamed protein product [Caenorhabditis auriculariae]|uniref:Peptidase M1 leukotriene A4 hydrolase/aminopeptidase C-terminal domain-containing protein n=1 Tax=Caenorhabditis auriculariae TaxID=2777116 RepID=A0A8S1HR91_9PELO|nr:unnamed protein product [Caenorhabditis auriculariae]
MENWGLITARQAESLYNPLLFPLTHKNHVQEVIAHEVAHQWFGNLVTMKWWNNLWLNEGFATMISLRAVDFLENTTLRYPEMTAEYMCIVLRTDQTDSQTFPVSSKGDEEVFSSNQRPRLITYRKAAIVIRMVERLVEEDIFRKGLHHFLNKFMYKNADQDDLYSILTYVHDSSSGGHLTGQNFSLADVMDTWLGQESVPVVHVSRKEGSIVTLRQQRYKHIPSTPPSKRDNYIWKIPIFYDDPVSGKHRVFWLTDHKPAVFDMGLQVVVDPYQLTYMRIRYDDGMYYDITKRLIEDHNSIPANSRGRLIDDTLAMAEHGQVSYEVPFNVTMYLPYETSFRPFHVFSAYLDFFLPRLYLEPDYEKYREWLLMILATQFDRMYAEGFESYAQLGSNENRLRELIVFRACGIDYKPCVEFAKKSFAELRQNCSKTFLSSVECNRIPFYIRSQVYSTAIQHGTQEDFDFLHQKWLDEHYMMERDRIWSGLSASKRKNDVYRIWTDLLQNKARDSIKERAVAFSKHLRHENHLLTFMNDRYKYVANQLRYSADSFQTMFAAALRGIHHVSQADLARTVMEKYAETFKIHSGVLGSIMGRFAWRRDMGPHVIGNATKALKQMRKIHAGRPFL